MLEALVRNGLSKEGCYQGQASHVSIAVNYGQWDWAHHLLKEGFPVEGPHQSVLAVMTAGRLQRALSKGMAELDAEEDAQEAQQVGTTAPDPLLGANVHVFPAWKAKAAQDQASASNEGQEPVQTGRSLLFEDSPQEQERINAMAAALVAAGASLEVRTPKDSMLWDEQPQTMFPPLFHAIYHLDDGMVEAIVKAGADLHSRPSDLPYRPLEMAITRGSASLVSKLLSAGAPVSPDPSHDGQAQKLAHPLVLCARMGLAHLIEEVGRALPEDDLKEYGVVAMHIAVANGEIPTMRALRKMGITYDAPTKLNGFRPLHQACFAGQEESIAFLLRRGQKWDTTSTAGLSAKDVLGSHHPHLMERFGLSLGGNVRTLFGRKPGPR